MTHCLRCELDALGAAILGQADPTTPPEDGDLAPGAALLCGRGDLAQDALHTTRARMLLTTGTTADRIAFCRALLDELRRPSPD